jgi:hypothetical protein
LIALVAAAFFCTPTLGADLTDISHHYRETRNIPGYVAGALVRVVWAGGPAGRAGINAGDVIQGVGSTLVQNACDVRRAVEKNGCDETRLTVRRGTDTLAIDVHLADVSRFKRKPGTCEGGDGAACTALAKKHEDDVVLLRQACDLGDGEGCFMLGLKLGNTEEGGAAYEQACDFGNPLACTNFGFMLQYGKGTRVDLDGAVRFYKKGCDGTVCSGRNNLGCVNLGRVYRDGVGVKVDALEAIRLFRDACGQTPIGDEDAGNIARSCSLAGTTMLFGKDIVPDLPPALALLEKGCNAGDAWGCFNLGALYETGDAGVEKDAARAVAYYKRACDGGDTEGCQRREALLR